MSSHSKSQSPAYELQEDEYRGASYPQTSISPTAMESKTSKISKPQDDTDVSPPPLSRANSCCSGNSNDSQASVLYDYSDDFKRHVVHDRVANNTTYGLQAPPDWIPNRTPQRFQSRSSSVSSGWENGGWSGWSPSISAGSHTKPTTPELERGPSSRYHSSGSGHTKGGYRKSTHHPETGRGVDDGKGVKSKRDKVVTRLRSILRK